MACIRKRREKLVVDYRNARGRRRWKTFEDTKAGKAEAEIFLGEQQKARRAGISTDDRITVGAFIDSWLAIVKKTVTAGTYAHYVCDCEKMRERFDGDRLLTLNAPRLLDFGTQLLDAQLAKATVATILGTVHTLLEHAVTYGYLTGNPASGLGRKLKLRRKETADIKAMTEAQLALFLRAIEAAGPGARVALTLYPYTGMRISEGLGLRVEDFDPDASRVSVRFQRLEDGQLHRLKTPASRRSVDLPAPLRDLLVDDLTRRREEALACGRPSPTMLLDERLTHKATREAMAAAVTLGRLPEHLTVHCLRHTFATLHLSRDPTNLLWVSRQLGHSSVKITADTYGGWIQPESPGTADGFAERIARQKVDLPSGRLLAINH